MDSVEQKLIDSVNKLRIIYNKKTEIISESKKEKENIIRTIDLVSNLDIDVYTDEIVKLNENLETIKKNLVASKELYDVFVKQSNVIRNLISYNGDVNEFCNLIDSIKTNIEPDDFRCFSGISKITGVKYPFQTKNMNDINTISQEITALRILLQTQQFNLDTNKVMNSIKAKLKVTFNFYQKTIPFLSNVLSTLEKKSKDFETKINDLKNNEIENRKKGMLEKYNELDQIIDDCNQSIKSIEKIYSLFDEYQITHDKEILVELINNLCDLQVLSERETKKITYQPKEKIEDNNKIIDKKNPNVESKQIVLTNIDSDYFRDRNTARIICFLGNEKNSILSDIEDYFDNSVRKKILEKLNSIFDHLYSNSNYISRAGGDPDETTSKKTLSLLTSPYNFTYRRYGEGVDKFRIHAIKRYSSLLNELGYGHGDIVFFGAIGPNDDTEKSKTYDRLGSRAVDIVSSKSNVNKLQPNFTYIEHITRRYIPKSLLSDDDKEKLEKGMINGKTKTEQGSLEKCIEQKKYVLYDILDDVSKSNVKKWLDNYFIEETNKLFEIKNMYKKMKGINLG